MAKEKTKKKRDAEGQAPPYNGSEVHATTTWPARHWPHPRPETYYAAPYNAYDWAAHAWPSHMRGDTNFPADFGAFPRGGFPYPGTMQPGPMPPSATPPGMGTSPPRTSPHSSNLSGKSQSEGSSFSETGDNAQDPNGEAGGTGNKHKRRRKHATAAGAAGGKINPELKNGSRDPKGKQQSVPEENTAKNKRYGIEEVKDLVKFRTDLQSKFETMSTHLELWTSIGEKMCEKGHPKRQWESYRDKWDIELRRYQKELKGLLAQAGLAENTKELEHPEQFIFSDDTLQEIHTRLTSRPKAALRSRFQSGVGGARGCLGEENAREVAGKRMKKGANNQVLVDSIVDKVVDKIGTFDETASAQGFKEVLDAVVNLTNVMLAEANPQPGGGGGYNEFEIDDKVFGWLKSIGKEQYASYFAASHVDWTNLLLLDKDDLMEMKIPIGPRKFILRELEKLRPPESAATQLKDRQTSEQEPEAETV